MTREERFKMDMIDEFKQMCEIVEKSGRIILNKHRMLKALEQEPTHTSEVVQKAYEDGRKDGYMQRKLEQEQDKPMIEIDLYSVIKQKYIEREVLDKIRAEIEQLRLHKAQFLTNDNKVCIDSQEVLNILDRYKAESEDT